MSELSTSSSSAGAEGGADPTAGGVPQESDLPDMQGLSEDSGEETDADRLLSGGSASEPPPEPGDAARSDAAAAGSDPMPDISGTDTGQPSR